MTLLLLRLILASTPDAALLEAFWDTGDASQATFTAPSGWTVCKKQAAGIKVLGDTQAVIERKPSEASRRTFWSWVRVSTSELATCHVVAVVSRAKPKEPTIVAASRQPDRLFVTTKNDSLATTPPNLGFAEAALDTCEGSRCNWIVALSEPEPSLVAKATESGRRVLALAAEAGPLSAGPKRFRFATGFQPGSLKLPSPWKVCSVGSGLKPVQNPPEERVELDSGANTADLVVTDAADCSDSQRRTATIVIVPALHGGLLPAPDDLTLDWSPDPSLANRLSVFVHSRALATNEKLRESTSLVVESHTGKWVLPCDTANDRCEYQIAAPIDWKSRSAVSLNFTFDTLGDLDADPVFDTNGVKLNAAQFPTLTVNRWLAPDFEEEELITLPKISPKDVKVALRLQGRFLRFATNGSKSCSEPNVPNCALFEVLPNSELASGALTFRLSNATIRTKLIDPLAPESVKVPLALSAAVLISPGNWQPILNPTVQVTFVHPKCSYELQQLTQVWADTTDGAALFSVKVEGASCAQVEGWSVATTEAGVVLERLIRKQGNFVFVYFRSLPAADVGRSVVLSFTDGNGNTIPTKRTVTLEINPAQTFSVDEVRVRLRERYRSAAAPPPELLDASGGVTKEPDTAAPSTNYRAIGLGRATWLRLSNLATSQIDNWSWELESPALKPCHPSETSLRGKPLLPFREGLLCVIGKQDKTKDAVLRGELKGLPDTFVLGSPSVSLPSTIYTVGFKRMTLDLEVRQIRLAVPLRDGAAFTCLNGDYATEANFSNPVKAVRMVKMPSQDFADDGCYAEVGFAIDREEANRIVKKCGAEPANRRVADPSRAERKACQLDVLKEKLEAYGPQRFVLGLSVSKNGGAFGPTKAPATSPVTLSTMSDLAARADREVVFDPDQPATDQDSGHPWLGVSIRLNFLDDKELNVEERDIVKLTISHETPGDFLTTLEDERSRSEPFEGVLRRAPENIVGPIGFPFAFADCCFPKSGVGPRAFATFLVPAGLVRVGNTGLSAKTSSQFAQLESPSIGLALLYVFEWYDYNRDKPWSPVNPQLQLGLLSSSNFKDPAVPVRLSGVIGLGLRLPLGTTPTSVLEAGTGLSVWLEITGGNVVPIQASLLFGLSASLGAIGG